MNPLLIAHLSDLHFGCLRDAFITEALLDHLNQQPLAAVIISGDLTQRARRRQFLQAQAFIKAIKAPVLVIPGNHDIPAWYHPVERMLYPYRRYQRYISPDLNPSLVLEQVSILGLNTAHGYTIKSGKFTAAHAQRMKLFFAAEEIPKLRILTVHHPPIALPEIGMPASMPSQDGQLLLNTARACGVQLILCGHWHHPLIKPLPTHDLYLAEAGTALSSRGRGAYRTLNSFFQFELSASHLTVVEFLYQPEQRKFLPTRPVQLDWL